MELIKELADSYLNQARGLIWGLAFTLVNVLVIRIHGVMCFNHLNLIKSNHESL